MKKLMTVVLAMLFAGSTGAFAAAHAKADDKDGKAKAEAKKGDGKDMKKDDMKKDDKKGDKGAKK